LRSAALCGSDGGVRERVLALPLVPWAGGVRDRLIRIPLDRVTGRRLIAAETAETAETAGVVVQPG
jgi:hypothetical protein